MNFYTNVASHRGNILVRGFRDGQRVHRQVKYRPYIFTKSSGPNVNTKYRTIKKESVERIDFESIGAAREFIKKYENVSGFEIYGMTQWQYPFIYDAYGQNMKYNVSDIRVVLLDIETDSSGGFPNIREADKEINAVTINYRGINYVYGFYEYTPPSPNTVYVQCRDEVELLHRVIDKLREIDPDVVSGWNSSGFDIPYITNRATKMLGTDRAKDLSPWGVIERREVVIKGKEHEIITWLGIASLDYIDVYKKFRSATRESYKLDYIANFEVGANKVDYAEYGSLDGLYKGNKQLYYEYNEHDVNLLVKIEDKLGLFNILYSLSYYMGCNFLDSFATVRPWDVRIHNYLMSQNIVVPPLKFIGGYDGIEGAYVRDPEPGLHEWVTSFDINSLYPSLARQCNISPETIITTMPGITVDMLYNRELNPKLREKLIEENASMCATGCIFDNSEEGFIPAVMRQVYTERVEFRDKEKKAKAKLEKAKKDNDLVAITKYTAEYAYYYGAQFARKIAINSLYGALSNQFFRWFDSRLSESITKTGQLTIRWAEQALNKHLNEVCGTQGINYVKYCDTDSSYISLSNFVKKFIKDTDIQKIVDKIDEYCEKKLQKVLDQAFNELKEYLNHREMVLAMKRENIADRAFWTAKKRYAMNVWDSEGTRYSTPELKVQGLESVKSSSPRVVRDLVSQALQVILNKTETDLHDFIDTARAEFYKRPFEEVAYTKTTNNLAKYTSAATIYTKGCPINVRAALMYNHMLRKNSLENKYETIGDGDKIKFVYLTMPNPLGSNAIAAPVELPSEFGLDEFIDHRLQFNKSFLEPVKAMTDAIGWTVEPISNLDALFEL